MYLIDTTILINEILNKYYDDEVSKKYLIFYRKIPLMKRIIPDFIVNEFELFMNNVIPARYFLNSVEKNQLHDVVSTYLRQISTNCTFVSPNQQIMKTAFSLFQNRTHDIKHISFTDSLLLATASQLQYTIISTDPEVLSYAAELRIPYFEPKNLAV